jgi:hypothetical protein
MYLLILSVLLFIFVLLFSFSVLIPAGKEYRIKRTSVKKQSLELKQLEDFSVDIEEKLQKLRSDNRHVINAFDTKFNAQRFQKQYKTYFSSLKLEAKAKLKNEQGFTTYEVNTTSLINSPQSFYNFLDAVNKSDWIIGIDFPINFQRESEVIKSSFSMKVYTNSKDTNNSDSNITTAE